MNIKTFIILVLLGLLVSCSITYEKNFGADDDKEREQEKPGKHNR